MLKRIFLCFFSIFLIMSCSIERKIESLKRLGTDSFDSKVWANADQQKRGKMIYDFIKKHSPITNKDRKFIINQLGMSTGYYEYDHFPAYYVAHKPPNTNSKAYLIAFIIDHKTDQVTDIYLPKN